MKNPNHVRLASDTARLHPGRDAAEILGRFGGAHGGVVDSFAWVRLRRAIRQSRTCRSNESDQAMAPRKIKIEVAVNEEFVQPTIDAIIKGGRSGESGEIGDGKIFVLPLEDCIRIRTGERGSEAI